MGAGGRSNDSQERQFVSFDSSVTLLRCSELLVLPGFGLAFTFLGLVAYTYVLIVLKGSFSARMHFYIYFLAGYIVLATPSPMSPICDFERCLNSNSELP